MPTLLILLAISSSSAESSVSPLASGTSATSAEAPVVVPPMTDQARRYYRSGLVLWCIFQVWLLIVPAAILGSGLSAKIRTLAWKLGRRQLFAVGLFGVLYLAINDLATLPLSYYAGFVRPHAYGLSGETFGRWLGDEAKAFGVMATMAFLGLWLPYWTMDRMPRRWWIAASIGYIPLAFTLMFLVPILVDPLFNEFGPMTDKALEAKILALAERAGIDGGRIYEVDRSEQTRTLNAYVKGFLGSKRIVLWDTLLAKLDDREVLFVMGHEMGHYVLGHVARTLLISSLGVLACLGFVHFTGNVLIRRHGRRFGFDRLGDVASLPLLILLGNLFVMATSPVAMAYSRTQEHEADRFALELTRDNRAGATAFLAFQRENLGNPRPGWFYKLWRATHPPLGERVEFCNDYRPWELGTARWYESLFRGPPP